MEVRHIPDERLQILVSLDQRRRPEAEAGRQGISVAVEPLAEAVSPRRGGA